MKKLYTSAERLQKRLAKKGFPSAIIGGIAIAIWGNPRVTRDVDFKVLIERDDSGKLIDALGASYKVLHDQPELAMRRLGFVFVQDKHDIRLDLLVSDTLFDREVIAHAIEIEILPKIRLRVCTAEDLIVYKMLSTRGRDVDDVQNVIARQQDKLDDAYILNWLRQFEQALDDSTLVSTYKGLRKKREPYD